MKFNWKSVIGWGVAALVVIGVVGTNMYNQKELQNSGKKNVYAVLPLSGSIAKSGQEYQQVLELYQKVNPNNNLNFIYVDSAFIPSQAVSALQSKIVSADKPLVVVTGTTVALAVLDNMALFIEALSKQNAISQESIVKMKDLETSSGKVEFLDDGDSKFEYVLATFKDGKIIPIEE